jgi:predicted lipid-binding transport protein (Tim44 family)
VVFARRVFLGRSEACGRPGTKIVLDAACPAPSPGVGADEVLAAARDCFVRLQAAWDAGDVEELRRYTTAEMLDELLQELPIRGSGQNRTDIVTLEGALLGLEQIGTCHVASVEFTGMIRESCERGAAPFKEMWLLTCHTEDVSGWRLARHQALM